MGKLLRQICHEFVTDAARRAGTLRVGLWLTARMACKPFLKSRDVTLYHGRMEDVLASLPDASVDSVVTDPPYELGFMGKAWDSSGVAFRPETWAHVLRVLKPGGHLLSFGGTRTYHRMACAVEDAGFEIRDMLSWLYGSGFPKSLDVSKAIDKQRHDREQVLEVTRWVRETRDRNGVASGQIDAAFKTNGMAGHWTSQASQPAVPTLEQWPRLLAVLGVSPADVPARIQRLAVELNGSKGQPGKAWQTAPVVGQQTKARSEAGNSALPTLGAATVYKTWDVKGANSDAAREWGGWGTQLRPANEPFVLARKPTPYTVAQNVVKHRTGALNIAASRIPRQDREAGWPANVLTDEAVAESLGRAAPYFYCPKPSRAEREGNTHATVKPLALMRYLCRLLTPPGGLVLDPFAGSGTTLLAAREEGFRAVGAELEREHCEIIRRRLARPSRAQAALL